MIAKIILPHDFLLDYKCDYLIGVDYGAYQVANQGIMMDLSIGDFDSVSEQEFRLIKEFSKECIILNVDKNETDSEAALQVLQNKNYMTVEMYSKMGSRFDHLLNNFRLLQKYDFSLITQHSKVALFQEGHYNIKNEYKVLSLFALDEVTLSLKGVRYELCNHTFNERDTYLTSNEIISDTASLNVIKGRVIVVLSND